MRNKEVEIEIEEVEPHGSKSLVEIVTEVENVTRRQANEDETNRADERRRGINRCWEKNVNSSAFRIV